MHSIVKTQDVLYVCLAHLKIYLNNNIGKQYCLSYGVSHWQKKSNIILYWAVVNQHLLMTVTEFSKWKWI